MISDLIEKKFAYIADGHVLFEVNKFQDYGKLSKRNQEQMLAGARVEVAPYKRNPADLYCGSLQKRNPVIVIELRSARLAY